MEEARAEARKESPLTPVPLFIVEEHHEAFFLWHHAAARGIIPATGNTLLHFDDHADWNLPRTNRPIRDPALADPAAAHAFAAEELGIATFILAGMYRGILERCDWIRRSPVEASFEKRLLLRARDEEGCVLVQEAYAPDRHLLHADGRAVTLAFMTRTAAFPEDREVILDVDLDYFSSRTPPDGFEYRIETTAEEQERFRADPYHPLRLAGVWARPTEAEGRRWFVLNRIDRPHPSPTLASKDEIRAESAAFGRFLAEKRVRPRMIEVSRSVRSGYTPPDQAALIEGLVIEAIRAVIPVEIRHVRDVLAEYGAPVARGA